MKNLTIYLFLIILVGSKSEANAQQRLQLKIGYNTGMPLGGFKDFMGKNSFRGFHADFLYPINEKFSVGLGVASQDYYEKHPRALYKTQDGEISAVVSNSVQTMPIMVKGTYNLTTTGRVSPYVGLAAGFNLISFGQYLGEFGESTSHFKPAASADAGVNFYFDKEVRMAGINAGANFNYMPYNRNNLKNLNNWGLHLGVFFPLR